MTLRKNVINSALGFQCTSSEHGILAQAFLESGEDNLLISYAYAAVANQTSDGRLAMPFDDNTVSDGAASGEAVWNAYKITGDPYLRDGADKQMEYLMMYAPRTQDGVIFHSIRPEKGYTAKQIWARDCYMAPPFLAVMGELTEATKQFAGYYNFLIDEKTGLFFEAYDVGSNSFISKILLAEGNSFALLGAARMLSGAVFNNEIEIATDLSGAAHDLIKRMLNFQREDGLLYRILDKPSSQRDVTSSLILAGVIYRGIYESWLDAEYKVNADQIADAIAKNRYIDKYGFIICDTDKKRSPLAQAAYILMDIWKSKAEM